MDLDRKQVETAVAALQLLLKEKGVNKLLDTPDKILLQFTAKKIPALQNKTIKLQLPHGLKRDNLLVCLFVKDLDRTKRDYTETVQHYKDLLKQHGVEDISEIIPMKCLKIMYKPYEAKRKLSNSFDLYLSDDRIVRLLPSLLGKHFYARKRNPVQVDLTSPKLKKEIDLAMNNSRCMMNGRGSTSSAYVAHAKLTMKEIIENVMAAAEQIAMKIPGGVENIRSFHIKTETSLAIPVFLSLDSSNNVDLPENEIKHEEIEAEDVTTVEGAKVRVYPDGTIEIVKDGEEDEHKSKAVKKNKKGDLNTRKRRIKPDQKEENQPKSLKEDEKKPVKEKKTSAVKLAKEKKLVRVSKGFTKTVTKAKKLRKA